MTASSKWQGWSWPREGVRMRAVRKRMMRGGEGVMSNDLIVEICVIIMVAEICVIVIVAGQDLAKGDSEYKSSGGEGDERRWWSDNICVRRSR